MIRTLAGGMKPVVFNNVCWSWSPLSKTFLTNGVRGYIGTLWHLGDSSAASTAAAFYEHVATMPVADALRKAATAHQPASDINIYVFYGFPFTRLHQGKSVPGSGYLVGMQLVRRAEAFRIDQQKVTHEKVKEELGYIIAWHKEAIEMHLNRSK